jgi:hypothetical protein
VQWHTQHNDVILLAELSEVERVVALMAV